jgi:membrane protein implicated in regulation of membrane protease activity
MADSTFWWLLAGGLVAAELMSGTFYLLMVAFGLMAAALSAHAGATLPTQLVAAALVSGGLVLAWRSYKKRVGAQRSADANADVNMDIGAVIEVIEWDAGATAQVKYRGANWQVSLADGDTPAPGRHQIIQVIGSRLVVKKI